ncbi:hypothetical protein OHR68_38150 [Spirillospora sp. NBC_00431]
MSTLLTTSRLLSRAVVDIEYLNDVCLLSGEILVAGGVDVQLVARDVLSLRPSLEVFGLGFPELVLRTMRDLSETNHDLLRAAALLEAFDTDCCRRCSRASAASVSRRLLDSPAAKAFGNQRASAQVAAGARRVSGGQVSIALSVVMPISLAIGV